MLCYTTIPSTSNTLKNLLFNSNYHSSYTNQEFNDKREEMITIFSTYVTPQIKEIHHPELLQEWKLNLDAAEYKKNMKANIREPDFYKKLFQSHDDTQDNNTFKSFQVTIGNAKCVESFEF